MHKYRPYHRIHRMDQINLWLPTCEIELENASNHVKNKLKDPKSKKYNLQRYAHYWYVQEYKFNRMLEEKTIISVLLSHIMNVEKICPEKSAVSV